MSVPVVFISKARKIHSLLGSPDCLGSHGHLLLHWGRFLVLAFSAQSAVAFQAWALCALETGPLSLGLPRVL